MSLQTAIADVQGYAGEVGQILEAASGKSPSAGKTIGVSVSADPFPEITAALNTITALASFFGGLQSYYQTPAMVNASEAEKLQAFKDRVASDLQQGDETDLERLENAS
jgi:hypothetical protein